jgi:hypothetical protein
MTVYTIDTICGHGTTTVKLNSPSNNHEYQLKWWRKNAVCKDCYKKQKEEEEKETQKKIDSQPTYLCTDTATLHFATAEAIEVFESYKNATLKSIPYHVDDAVYTQYYLIEGHFGDDILAIVKDLINDGVRILKKFAREYDETLDITDEIAKNIN